MSDEKDDVVFRMCETARQSTRDWTSVVELCQKWTLSKQLTVVELECLTDGSAHAPASLVDMDQECPQHVGYPISSECRTPNHRHAPT